MKDVIGIEDGLVDLTIDGKGSVKKVRAEGESDKLLQASGSASFGRSHDDA